MEPNHSLFARKDVQSEWLESPLRILDPLQGWPTSQFWRALIGNHYKVSIIKKYLKQNLECKIRTPEKNIIRPNSHKNFSMANVMNFWVTGQYVTPPPLCPVSELLSVEIVHTSQTRFLHALIHRFSTNIWYFLADYIPI